MILIDIKRRNITPGYSTPLLGYFTQRISEGVMDSLYCRLLQVKTNYNTFLFIQIDNCLLPEGYANSIRKEIAFKIKIKPECIMIFASHTHTAPALCDFFQTKKDARYRSELKEKIIETAKTMGPGQACRVKTARTFCSRMSFNRRWWMKNGVVITNPPKCCSEAVQPEGPSDPQVQVVGFFPAGGFRPGSSSGQSGNQPGFFSHGTAFETTTPIALLVSISNHTDTIGESLISADWPGIMEKYINAGLRSRSVRAEAKPPATVVTMIAPQGNINHFDPSSPKPQTGYTEAKRLAQEYANIVLGCLQHMDHLHIETTACRFTKVKIPPREVSVAQVEEARKVVEKPQGSLPTVQLTSEDLATGSPAIKKIMARELIQFVNTRPQYYRVPLQVLKLGEVFFCAIPAEPFVEMGLRLKQSRDGGMVVPVACANGYFGYVPLPECFDRGGYEILPTALNCLSKKAFYIILNSLTSMLAGENHL
ncbi:MAG: hypothetical protein ACOC7U_10375 [Spirochaetota bacterium]